MQSKSRIITSAALAGVLYGVALAAPPKAAQVVGNGIVTTETRAVRDFHGIDISGVGELTITQGNRESLAVEAESSILPLLDTRVEGGILRLGVRQASVNTNKAIRYRVTLRNLDRIHASGASKIMSGPIETGHLDAQVSGAGSLKIEHLKTGTLELEISGASNAQIAGSADRQHIAISRAGKYDGARFVTKDADVSLSGASQADIDASGSLKATASGASSVRYHGSPQTDVSVSGAASVTPVR